MYQHNQNWAADVSPYFVICNKAKWQTWCYVLYILSASIKFNRVYDNLQPLFRGLQFTTKNDKFFYFLFRHNDLPWNIRKFIHNKLNTVNFTSNLKTENPWGTSPWSHTDLTRLVNGHVGGQVRFQVVNVNIFY